MKNRRIVFGVLGLIVIGLGATRVYDIELSENCNGNTDPPQHKWVGETFVAVCDSVQWCAAFIGRPLSSGDYVYGIYDSTGSTQYGVNADTGASGFRYEYAPAFFRPAVKVLKGVKYMLRVSHSEDSVINYYYNSHDPYTYGHLIVNGQKSPGLDLAARVEGVNVPDTMFVSLNFNYSAQGPWLDTTQNVISRRMMDVAESAQVRILRRDNNWRGVQWNTSNPDTFDWTERDCLVIQLAQRNIKVYWILCASPVKFTSGPQPDSYRQFGHQESDRYPPKYLEKPAVIGNVPNDSNRWGKFVFKAVERYGPGGTLWATYPQYAKYAVTHFEVWNEPNSPTLFFGFPRYYYTDSIPDTSPYYFHYPPQSRDTTKLCNLYVRMAEIADEVVKKCLPSMYDSITFLTGSTARLTVRQDTPNVKGTHWLRMCFDRGIKQYCKGIAIHPYQHEDSLGWFDQGFFESSIDTARQIMADAGAMDKVLWVTEVCLTDSTHAGPGASEERQADGILATFVSGLGSAVNPRGPYDHISWYALRDAAEDTVGDPDPRPWVRHSGVRKDGYALAAKYSYHALKQFRTILGRHQLNRRLHIGDVAKDDSVRIYEFEDTVTHKRTWVGWKNDTVGTVAVTIPVKTDAADTIMTAYNNEPPSGSKDAGQYGYLGVALGPRPTYIVETGETLRPDMIVDSIWTSPNPPQVNNPVRVYAKIKNTGNDSTKPGIADSVIFYVDGVKKAWVVYDSAIHQNSSAIVFRDSVWTPDTTRPYLVKVTVNGSRVFMELSFDNNGRYRMYDISYLPPTGSVKINADEPFTNSRYSTLDLWSYNPNKADSVYADYMKIWQYYVVGAETLEYSTDWLPFHPEHTWRLKQNQGGNRVFARFKINEGNLTSSEYSDSILVDWTYPETLKMVINHDNLFTSDTVCTLANHAVDLGSGISKMRFGNGYLKNLIRNGDFADSTNGWSGRNCQWPTGESLVYLTSVAADSSYLSQTIAKDSIIGYDGDSMAMTIDAVSDTLIGNGYLEFRYVYVCNDSQIQTKYGLPPIISIPAGHGAKVGQYNLWSYFLFHPDPPGGYTFDHALVRLCIDDSSSNSGKIIADNIRLEPVGPVYDFSRFKDYDTTELWKLDAEQGVRWVYAQYQDQAGNESQCIWDSIYLDISAPTSHIGSPSDSQMVNGTITIWGSAYDGDGHFLKYDLDYMPSGGEGLWYPVNPDSEGWTPVYGMPPWGDSLGGWWTDSVADGWYHLRLLTQDSAHNYADTSIFVHVLNDSPPGGGDGFGGFGGEAEAMSLDKDDNLYLTSTETPADQIDLRVRKYSPTGESLLSFSAKLASDSTRIPWPSAIVVDDSSRILVLDGLNNCLKVFDKTGKLLVKVGSRGSGHGQFIDPSDVKWDGSGKAKLFITDKGNKRVQVLSKQGGFLRQFGTDSIPLNDPVALVHNRYNQTCVLDVQNDTGKLFVYDSTGKLKRTVTKQNLKNPTALAIDTKDNLFIADAGNNRILELSPILTHIYSFGTEGDSFGQFRNPTALTITKDRRYLYVYDRTKKTISKFTMIKSKKRGGGGGQSEELTEILPTQLLLYAPKPNPAKRIATLKYAVPRQEKVSLVIYDIVGRQARTITNRLHKPGFYAKTWDGKDDRGNELAAGVYFCLLKDDEKVLTRKVVVVR